MIRAVCLQHVPFEGPGALAPLLATHGCVLDRYLVPEEGLPADPGDLLMVMGGPMSVNDPDQWIHAEIAFLARAVHEGVPVLGICLGSQLLARALGATVRPGPGLELGMTPIRLTADGRRDPVFGSMPESFEVFEWHGEVFDLPEGAVALASSELCPLQAFRYGASAYGLLFHLEMEPSGIEALCRECPTDLARANLERRTLLMQTEPHLPRLHRWADRLVAHLLAPSH